MFVIGLELSNACVCVAFVYGWHRNLKKNNCMQSEHITLHVSCFLTGWHKPEIKKKQLMLDSKIREYITPHIAKHILPNQLQNHAILNSKNNT